MNRLATGFVEICSDYKNLVAWGWRRRRKPANLVFTHSSTWYFFKINILLQFISTIFSILFATFISLNNSSKIGSCYNPSEWTDPVTGNLYMWSGFGYANTSTSGTLFFSFPLPPPQFLPCLFLCVRGKGKLPRKVCVALVLWHLLFLTKIIFVVHLFDMWKFDIATKQWSIANPDGMDVGIWNVTEISPEWSVKYLSRSYLPSSNLKFFAWSFIFFDKRLDIRWDESEP